MAPGVASASGTAAAAVSASGGGGGGSAAAVCGTVGSATVGGGGCERRDSVGTVFRRQMKHSFHFDSAAVGDKLSPLQVHRQIWEPTLPISLRGPVDVVVEEDKSATSSTAISADDKQTLASLFPATFQQPFVKLVRSKDSEAWQKHPPLRVGVVLSGGQAPGGHNVISGIYDCIKQCNPNSQLFGFLGGPHGIFTHNYVEVLDEFMNTFRNQGGFDMIRSGRHKIETDEQKMKTLEICQKLDLHGLVVVGGDDSNTNAAIIAEYFKARSCKTCVVGCPKTIDGDLRSEFVEASFGFDTAVKTYAEFVGNLCEDVATSGKYYHFVRLMGRSASHITLECALQTRPNLAFIGEEIQANKTTLKEIVAEIVEMVLKRNEMGRDYGVILLPEGLIEFTPQVGKLIGEINTLMAEGRAATAEAIGPALSCDSRAVFDLLPPAIRQQLLLSRDPHGNVQVAMIATERLLILMVESELQSRCKKTDVSDIFHPQYHYFGYEGRCGMPSVFDANYCYALGHVAASLVDKGCTGCMAVLKGLHSPPENWQAAGCPLTVMMNIETRKGKKVPVIKKYLVELDKPMFLMFAKVREEWKYRDLYRSPGPVQFAGPVSSVSNFTIVSPTLDYLLPAKPTDFQMLKKRHHFVRSLAQMSELQRDRLQTNVLINPLLRHPRARACADVKLGYSADQTVMSAVSRAFPLLIQLSKNATICSVKAEEVVLAALSSRAGSGLSGGNKSPRMNTVLDKEGKGLVVGVVLTGQQAPGVANVIIGLYERVSMNGGRLIGFHGADGLMESKSIEITAEDLALTKNQGGFNVLGRTGSVEPLVASTGGLDKIRKTCESLDLDGLVLIGGCWTLSDCSRISESFLQCGVKTRVIGVPCSQSNNIDSRFIESTIGFDSASKCYSQLIGNLLTDAASATKYWYFVRLMGRDKSHMVVEAALQTHSNVTLVSEALSAGDKTLQDVVMDIADVICARAESGKNFGTVLIPEGLMSELPQMRQLLTEVAQVLADVTDWHQEKKAVLDELVDLDPATTRYSVKLTSWSWTLLKSLPPFIRKQIIQPRSVGRLQLSKIAAEELISQMVSTELGERAKSGVYTAAFSPVCFYFGYQARSSLPSLFDCSLGLSHGYLSGICVESGLTGYATSMRGLCGAHTSWMPVAIPLVAMLRMPPPDEMYASKVPMVLSEQVKLDGKAMKQLQNASRMWEQEDRFCNPGPLQFYGDAMYYYTRYLFEQQHDYIKMLEEVDEDIKYLKNICTFGVDELTLKATYHTLNMAKRLIKSMHN
eukprot:GHVS01088861.1.p1 GENE.GHVS01088861.1~~GHVS01088861.1.p1  ORF type:complete len:1296 (+),score=269.55 GHVS01088861.1:54-3890(+)